MNLPKVEIALFWTDEGSGHIPCYCGIHEHEGKRYAFVAPIDCLTVGNAQGRLGRPVADDFCFEAHRDAMEDDGSTKLSMVELKQRLREAGAVFAPEAACPVAGCNEPIVSVEQGCVVGHITIVK